MLFGFIILLLIGVIAFFHYVQGLFSATISAVLTVISAVLAVSYHETVVNLLLKGKVADEADAMVLCVLFAVVYLILRLIFDAAVPGNLRFPPTVDKVGSAIMGIITGIFATGVFALAAQSLPFGPSIGMYSRYPLKDKQGVIVPTGRQELDSVIYDELNGDTFEPAHENSLLVPVDDILLATVQHASDGGALAGSQTLTSVHPDYPAELFADRLGIQVGAKRTASNLGDTQSVQVLGAYSVPELATSDPEFSKLRTDRKIPATMLPKADQVLLILRFQIDHTAADDADGLFRFSMGSIRLVANGKDYYPIGTVDNANLLYMQKPDDFIFLDLKANPQGGFDAAFLVDKDDLVSGGGRGAANAGEPAINDGVFVEVKRLAQVDLSGKAISASYSSSPTVVVVRKQLNLDPARKVPETLVPRITAKTSTPSKAARAPKLPVVANSLKTAAPINYKIGVTTTDVDAQNVTVAGGTISLKDSKLAVVAIDPTESIEKLATGDNQLADLYAPTGKQIVQITGARPGANPWDWVGQIGSLELVDSNNNRYSPNGFLTLVKDGEKSGLFMRYDAQKAVGSVTPPSGTPAVVTYFFVVPSGSQLTQISASGQQAPVDLTVP